ncbi:MAG TPA: GNAT family N-acetyltransferase [Allocoleopsis sp.]
MPTGLNSLKLIIGYLTIVNHRYIDINPNSDDQALQSLESLYLTVRQAEIRDTSTAADILADSFYSRTGFWRWIYPLFKRGIYEDLRMKVRSYTEHSICLVAVYTNNSQVEFVVGTVEMNLRFSTWHNSAEYLYISNLAVAKDYRRKGVARELLLKCERTALKWGFSELYLHVMENNNGAKHLYRQLGYRTEHIIPSWSYYLFRQPRKLFLHKILSATSDI